MQATLMVAGCLWLVTGAPRVAAEGTGDEAPRASQLYVVDADDTLEGISRRYLGTGEAIPELLGYNQIVDPNSVVEGTVLDIPLNVRSEALAWLAQVEEQLVAAHQAAADVYAPEVFEPAQQLRTQAAQFRRVGDYSRTVALAKRGEFLAKEAKRLADLRAPIQEPARISFVYGGVETSVDGGETWVSAAKDDALPVGGRLRTAADARAEVTLADGSVIQLQQDSQFELENFRLDRRSGVRSSRLRVHTGGILGTVEPEKVRASEFEIDTGAASVAIRGTRLRVVTRQRDTRLSTLAGRAALEAQGATVEVPENFGAVVRGGKPPGPPVELLPAPGGLTPQPILHRTAIQTPIFGWDPVIHPRTAAYRLEIAQDQEFHRIQQDHRVTQPRVQAEVLSAGRYYWRVLTIDRDGLEGAFTGLRGLEVVKNFDVSIHPTEPLMQQGSTQLARPQVGYLARPARTDTSVVRIWCSLDGASWAPVEGPITLEQDGDYTIHVRGECLERERGPIQTLDVRVDGTPPEVEATVGTPTTVEGLGPTVFVRLQAKDPSGVARIEFGFDGKEFVEYGQPVVLSAADRGRLYFRAIDTLGNVSPAERLDVPSEPVPH